MIEIEDDLIQMYRNKLKEYPYFERNRIDFEEPMIYHTKAEYRDLVKSYGIGQMLDGDFLRSMAKISQFVHKLVPFTDKKVIEPCRYDGFELLDYCKRGGGLNCTGYSIILNDILLSLGIKSRCVWCLSYNHPFDNECHAVNQVFDAQQQAWMIVDAAFGCIPIIDTRGIDIITLRNAIMADKEITFLKLTKNHDAVFANMYRRYMTKNTFMFLTLKTSGLHYNTEKEAILIIPEGFERNCVSDYNYPYFITQNTYFLER